MHSWGIKYCLPQCADVEPPLRIAVYERRRAHVALEDTLDRPRMLNGWQRSQSFRPPGLEFNQITSKANTLNTE